MALQHRQTMSVEEYFQLERNDPDARYEYIDGYIYAMAGGTFNHDTIKSNIQRILWGLLRERMPILQLISRSILRKNATSIPTSL